MHLISAVSAEVEVMMTLGMRRFEATPTMHRPRADDSMTAGGANMVISVRRKRICHPAVTYTRISLRKPEWRW